MKCPFCNAELDYQIHTGEYACINTENCKFSFMVLPKKWWQALIDGKKAQEALDYTIRYLKSYRRRKWDISYANICLLVERIENKVKY